MNGLQVVGRLAPSPTGAQHLGNARTYLLAWLSARAQNGRVILRIEDIDSPRVKSWATEQAIQDLQWLGLDWDEGPDVGGPHAPYVQTQRNQLYEQALQRLRERELIYPCSCSRTDIAEAASAPHVGTEGPAYPGTCANWGPADPIPESAAICWRYRTDNEDWTVEDAVAGRATLNPARVLGDFPVTRKGGTAAYQLAVVVDDAAMGVTEVVRGNDLLNSAFRQLQLYRSLELIPPKFCHVPLVIGKDGRRLAKRHGDTRLSWYRQQSVKPQEIVGWAAYTANFIERDEPLSAAELLQHIAGTFRWSNVPTENVVVEGRFPVG